MENKNLDQPGSQKNETPRDWQHAENHDNRETNDANAELDLRSAEAGGYGIDNRDTVFIAGSNQDKKHNGVANDADTVESDN